MEDVHREWTEAVERKEDMVAYGKKKLEEVQASLLEVQKPIEEVKFAMLAGNRTFTDVKVIIPAEQTQYVLWVDHKNEKYCMTVQVKEVTIHV